MIKAIIFDLDDTLYDFEIANCAGIDSLRAYAKKNFNWDQEKFDKLNDNALTALNIQTDYTAASHDRLLRFALLCEEQKLPLSHAINLTNAYWNAFFDNMHIFNGVKQTLEEIKKRNYVLGLGTNMVSHQQFRKLQILNLIDLFDFIVTSEETIVEKPEKEFFLRCAEKAKCKTEECVFTGDNINLDFKGAAQAGMKALLFDKKKNYEKTSVKSFYEQLFGKSFADTGSEGYEKASVKSFADTGSGGYEKTSVKSFADTASDGSDSPYLPVFSDYEKLPALIEEINRNR